MRTHCNQERHASRLTVTYVLATQMDMSEKQYPKMMRADRLITKRVKGPMRKCLKSGARAVSPVGRTAVQRQVASRPRPTVRRSRGGGVQAGNEGKGPKGNGGEGRIHLNARQSGFSSFSCPM